MRVLLLSDVHANLQALEAVLRHARLKRWDEALFLGDAIGYGPQPNEVVELLRELAPSFGLVGNHEDLLFARAEGRQPLDYLAESVVEEVVARHLSELTPENLAFLQGLTMRAAQDGWEATHGALSDPWEYVTNLSKAQEQTRFMSAEVLFVGHTHIPRLFASVAGPDGDMWRTLSFSGVQSLYRIPPRARVIFNPGSVGQPRDGVPLASYAIFDAAQRTLEHHRVEYDVSAVQRALHSRGYPESLAVRLALGG